MMRSFRNVHNLSQSFFIHCIVDGIPNLLLKDCADIFSLSFQCCPKDIYYSGFLEEILCMSNIKKGDINNVSNYRQASLLCNVSKIFETLIYQQLE